MHSLCFVVISFFSFKDFPSIVELDSLKVTGDVRFGADVTLKGSALILLLGNNQFHDIFPLGWGRFQGKLPYEHFQSWTSMKVANMTFEKNNVYMVAHMRTTSRDFTWSSDFSYSLEITNKGIKTLYEKDPKSSSSY
uniref:Uncharacterized protein n=1 Tax=Quercus lobata TaxID=97700 RepID=A0A7N2L6J3_QUELO